VDIVKEILNPHRGCGYLKHNAFYIRCEVEPYGKLPKFVWFDPVIPYLEPHFRGWSAFNGAAFEVANRPETMVIGDASDVFGSELKRHLKRMRNRGKARSTGLPSEKNSLGHDPMPWQQDIVMWVGESYYDTPLQFVAEGIRYGFNKRIRINTTPPRIVPGSTKLYLLHSNARLGNGERGPALFGYCYITSVIYTIPEDGKIPQFIDELTKLDRVQPAHIGPQIDDEATKN